MEKFPSFSEEAEDREERLSFEALPRSAIEDAQALERQGILKKLGNKPWVKRFTLTLGGLAGAFGMGEKGLAQTPREVTTIQESANAAKEHVAVFAAYVKLAGERSKGNVDYPTFGSTPEAKAVFKREDPGEVSVKESVRTNDFFTMVKKETAQNGNSLGTQYFFDSGNNGSLDAVVLVPGTVDDSLDTSVVVDCTTSYEDLMALAKGQALRKTDKTPLKDRMVFLVNGGTDTVMGVNFSDGKNENNAKMIDSGKSAALTMQASWEIVAGSLRARIDSDLFGLKASPIPSTGSK